MTRLAILCVFLGGVAAFSQTANPAAPSNPKELFGKRCGGCHALDRDKEGPRLGGVYGRPAGSIDSFTYSDALKKAGITWNADTLEKWLTDPEKFLPGSTMPMRVINADERAVLIDYLKSMK